MADAVKTLDMLDRRLDAVRKRVRWSGRAGCAALMGLCSAHLVGQNAETLTASRIVVIDSEGRERIVLATDEIGARITLVHETGDPGVLVSTGDARSGLRLFHPSTNGGGIRVMINARQEGAFMALFDDKGSPSMELTHEESDPKLSLYGSGGEATLYAGTTGPHLKFTDAVPPHWAGGPTDFRQRELATSAWIGVKAGEPGVGLYDSRGKPVFERGHRLLSGEPR